MSQKAIDLIDELDQEFRKYARRLDSQQGEDAYHNAVCDLLSREQKSEVRNPRGLFVVAIRRALYKIFRHENSERTLIDSYLHGDPSPYEQGLRIGRQKQTRCRKGLHDLIDGNLAYIGLRRTCLACMQDRMTKKK